MEPATQPHINTGHYSNKTPKEFEAAVRVIDAFLKYGTVEEGRFTMGAAYRNVTLDDTLRDRRPLSSALQALEQSGCQLPWVLQARVKWMRLLLKTWAHHTISKDPAIALYHHEMHARCARYLGYQYGAEFSDISDSFLTIMNNLRSGPAATKWERRMWLHIQHRTHCRPDDSARDPTAMRLLLDHYRLPLDCPPEQ